MDLESTLSGVDLGTIPTENVVLASAILSAYIAYQTRKNSLETNRERERFLNFRLQDTAQFSDTWGVRITNVFVNENSGILYRLRKLFLDGVSGDTTIAVTYKGKPIPESYWEKDKVQKLVSGYDVEVEHIQTIEHLDPVPAKFRIHSTEYDDIVGFFNYMIEFDEFIGNKRLF